MNADLIIIILDECIALTQNHRLVGTHARLKALETKLLAARELATAEANGGEVLQDTP